MKRIFEDGLQLVRIWWETEEQIVLSPNSVLSLVVREQYCGNYSEWFVECTNANGEIDYHNMKFISGFRLLQNKE